MLMMLMMMKLEQVPTFFAIHSDTQINCTIKQWMDGSFGECSVEDQPVDCMPNVTRVSVEHNACY